MVDMEELIETYRQKVINSKHAENYDYDVIEPQLINIFNEEFMQIFEDITQIVNTKVNSNVINFKAEAKNRFSIEGRFHRVTFQKSKTEIIDNIANVNIIPLCTWKGVTKHLGPIAFITNLENNKTEWDLPAMSVEEFIKRLFRNLAEDQDFYM